MSGPGSALSSGFVSHPAVASPGRSASPSRRREAWSREPSPSGPALCVSGPGPAGKHPRLPRALPLHGRRPSAAPARSRRPGCSHRRQARATLGLQGWRAEVTREHWKVLPGLGLPPWSEASMSGDMKPEEGGSEPGTSQELLQRLRELEAENLALAQANENQRETYERCLDEVANHVVQALLNQKDLRQECLKLKKRVFDLERQNRTLSDLFQQKLQLSTGSLPQLALHPVPVLCSPPSRLQLGTVEKLGPSLPLGRCVPREVGSGGLRAGSPGSPSMEALSPFFKKKAQILEVLRKLEETDPLLCPPPCQLPPWMEPSQAPTKPGSQPFQMMPAEAGSPPESPLNGEGPPAEPPAPTHQLWPPCLLLAPAGLEEALRWKGEEEGSQGGGLKAEGGRPQVLPPLCCPQKGEGSSSSSSEELGELGPLEKGPPGEAHLSALAHKALDWVLLEDTECYLQHFLKEGCPLTREPAPAYRLEGSLEPLGPGLSRDALPGLSVMGRYQPIAPASGLAQASAAKLPFGTAAGEQALERQAYLSVFLSGDKPPEESAEGLAQLPAQEKPQLQPGPPSAGSGALPVPSPGKVLKFLRVPTPGEKPQSSPALRLSPQLTRSSKIPCRSSNHEVCPLPGLSHRASPEGPTVPSCPLPPGAESQASPKAARPLAPGLAEESFSQGSPKAHNYENLSELSVGGLGSLQEQPKCSRLVPPCPPEPCPCAPAKERGAESPLPARRGAGSSGGPRRPVSNPGKKAPEPGQPPFKERLSALGKLRSAEGGERKEAPALEKGSCPGKGRAPLRPCEEALEARAQPRPGAGGSLKHQEPAGRCYSSGSVGSRLELESCSAKQPTAKARQPPPSPRTPPKAPPVPPAKGTKSPHGSPTKLPSKSPTKAASRAGAARPPAEELQPGSPQQHPPASALGPARHSAIEEKVMKGIEENVLRRQEDKALAGEGKARSSSALASWFGLRRSKLPALNRRPEVPKAKEERKDRGPGAKREAERLNISRLMEKAEGLRKALEEEQAYVQGLALEKGRPHARGPPPPSQLQVMYQEVTAQDFMQQLLDRVDGKETYGDRLEQKRELRDLQRVSHDAKDPRLCRPPRNGLVCHLRSCQESPEKGEVPSESLAEAVTAQHFTACGSLTRTLDSGIGTFPPPDYCSGAPSKNPPKPKPGLEPPASVALGRPPGLTRVARKARTLEREVPSTEGVLLPGKHQSLPAVQGVLAVPEPPLRRCGPQDPRVEPGRARRVGQSKNSTFPNAKACGGSADPFLCAARALEGLHGLGGSSVRSTAQRESAAADLPCLRPPSSLAFSASGSRTPSASDVGEDGSTDLKSRDTGQGQPGLETSESLSDSLYDSLSSCGSQG